MLDEDDARNPAKRRQACPEPQRRLFTAPEPPRHCRRAPVGNRRVCAAPPPPPAAAQGRAPPPPGPASTLTVDEVLGMVASGTVILTEKIVYDNAIVVGWEPHPNATAYRVALSKAGDAGSPAPALVVNATRHAFAGLEPSSSYTIDVGAAGDDSARSTLNVTTLPAGSASLPSGLLLDASLRPRSGMVDLAWIGAGSAAGGLAQVEMSVDGGPFGPAPLLRLLSGSSAEMPVGPEWLGKTLAYRVHDQLGSGPAYSANATVQVPAALEAPRSVAVASGAGTASAGAQIVLAWDHSVLFRHYVVEAHNPSTGTWEQAATTSNNTVSIVVPPTQGDEQDNMHGFRVLAQLGSALSPPSDVVWHATGGKSGSGGAAGGR